MPAHICATCGTQYPESETPPAACPICEDERQYVARGGQRWTTPEALAADRGNTFRQVQPGLLAIRTEPQFAIGQRALLIRTGAGNVLWDCLSHLDDATTQIIQAFGGLKAIALSHPHFYTRMALWGRTFDCPVHVHAADREQVMVPGPHLHFWEGEAEEILPGITVYRVGGHFPGSSLLHWAEGQALLTGDTMLVVPDLKHVTFMWSFPNLVPLPAEAVEAIGAQVAELDFDAVHSALPDRSIMTGAKAAVARSVARYVEAVRGPEPLR